MCQQILFLMYNSRLGSCVVKTVGATLNGPDGRRLTRGGRRLFGGLNGSDFIKSDRRKSSGGGCGWDCSCVPLGDHFASKDEAHCTSVGFTCEAERFVRTWEGHLGGMEGVVVGWKLVDKGARVAARRREVESFACDR
ncbi:hypothetical protein E2542_SST29613 [Spatholobus suberectus]|nr:hypothetical protein E2542_SST29613 [Spatholobus suberectus]